MAKNKLPAFDQQLLLAYQKAIYRVFDPALELRIGQVNQGLNALLVHHHYQTAIFLTAYNPFSQLLTPVENMRRQEKLIRTVQAEHRHFYQGQGEDPSGKWAPEQSLLILGLGKEAGQVLGQQFGQNAIVYCAVHQTVELFIV